MNKNETLLLHFVTCSFQNSDFSGDDKTVSAFHLVM